MTYNDHMHKEPLLANNKAFDLKDVTWPRMWSPKLDGWRALNTDAGLVTRKFKLMPNEKLRAFMGRFDVKGFDGEILFGPITHKDVFNHTQSCCSTVSGPCPTEADGKYLVFDDMTNPDDPFEERFARLQQRVSALPEEARRVIQIVPHKIVTNLDDLMNIERVLVEKGFEGVMLRDPKGRYKYGRSTFREGILLKVKRFEDFDGQITDAYEMMHNGNEAQQDAFGRTKRSSHQENKRPSGMLGGFTVQSPEFPGQTVNVGPAVLTHDERKALWEQWLADPESLRGKWLTAKYQPSGMKDAPRFAGFKGFRKD